MERHLGTSGLAVVVLFGFGNALWATAMPKPGSSQDEIVSFYVDRSGRIVAGASLSLLALAVFTFFVSGVRRVLAREEGDDVLPTTAFAGALIGGTAGLGAETINMVGAMRAADGSLDGPLARSLYEISQVLGFNAAGVGMGVFGLATAGSALRSGVLPRWLSLATAAAGLALLTPLSRVAFAPAIPLVGLVGRYLSRAA